MGGPWWLLKITYVYIILSICLHGSVVSVHLYPYYYNLLGINGGPSNHVSKKDFPDFMKAVKVKHVQSDPESWTGRWFPESLPTEPPSSATLNQFPGSSTSVPLTKSSDSSKVDDLSLSSLNTETLTTPSTDKQVSFLSSLKNLLSSFYSETTTESWTGRWFPDYTTPMPPALEQPKSIEYHDGSEPNLKYSLSTNLRNDSLMSRAEESWTGRWLPERITSRPDVQQPVSEAAHHNSMWQMINSTCDDGKTNLTVDWDGDPVNYTCYNPHNYFEPDYDLPNLIIKSAIPKAYEARHACMNTKLEYTTDLPTFGAHRPAWPRYGEYKFVPKQRWLHNLEHGAVVMLYHPCAHPVLVNELKELVASCLYRHIITPYTLLSPERPMAILTWGWALLLNSPDKRGVMNFIREHALRGPEASAKDGQFSEGLISPSKIITDADDTNELGLCPQTLF